MNQKIINQLKRRDVFRCSQEAHSQFGGKVSVYHVMKEKACYPQGCLYFIWHCVLFQKGNRCVRGYRFVGKNCKGCTYYEEEKVHLQPEVVLREDQYRQFLEDFDGFETWLNRVRYRRMEVAGRIQTVKPWFTRRFLPGESHTRFQGYLLVFKRGYIGLDQFDDTFYIRVSENLMKAHGFVPKMKLELEGEIREDRGRIVVQHPKRIEIIKSGWGRCWTREKALVAVKTATWFEHQSDQCLSCRWSVLVDVQDRRDVEEKQFRSLYCLKGVANWDGCYVYASRNMKKKILPNKEKI